MTPQLTKANDLATFFFLLVLAASFFTGPAASARCGFNIYVQTGGRKNAGTDAVVSLVISNQAGTGTSLTIPNLADHGRGGPGYDYFERGQLDSFYAVSECLPGPPCWMMLAQDNSGNKPGWYVDYVLVITTSGQHQFGVYQWLARDETPYQLATTRNDCGGRRRGVDSSKHDGEDVDIMPTTSSTSLQIAAAAEAIIPISEIHDDDEVVAREGMING